MSRTPLFHIVNLDEASGSPPILHDIDIITWPYAIYKRVDEPAGLVYGLLMGIFHNKDDATCTCASLNTMRDILVSVCTGLEDEIAGDVPDEEEDETAHV